MSKPEIELWSDGKNTYTKKVQSYPDFKSTFKKLKILDPNIIEDTCFMIKFFTSYNDFYYRAEEKHEFNEDEYNSIRDCFLYTVDKWESRWGNLENTSYDKLYDDCAFYYVMADLLRESGEFYRCNRLLEVLPKEGNFSKVNEQILHHAISKNTAPFILDIPAISINPIEIPNNPEDSIDISDPHARCINATIVRHMECRRENTELRELLKADNIYFDMETSSVMLYFTVVGIEPGHENIVVPAVITTHNENGETTGCIGVEEWDQITLEEDHQKYNLSNKIKTLDLGEVYYLYANGFKYLENVRLSPYMKEIPDNSFKNSIHLSIVEVPYESRLERIGKNCFEGCTELRTLDFSNCGKLTFEKDCFKDCPNLKTIVVSDIDSQRDGDLRMAYPGLTIINKIQLR